MTYIQKNVYYVFFEFMYVLRIVILLLLLLSLPQMSIALSRVPYVFIITFLS